MRVRSKGLLLFDVKKTTTAEERDIYNNECSFVSQQLPLHCEKRGA